MNYGMQDLGISIDMPSDGERIDLKGEVILRRPHSLSPLSALCQKEAVDSGPRKSKRHVKEVQVSAA